MGKPQASAGIGARALRRSATIFQRPCWFLRWSVAARLLPKARPDLWDLNLNRPLAHPSCLTKGQPTCGSSEPLVTVDARARPLWHAPSAGRVRPGHAVGRVADGGEPGQCQTPQGRTTRWRHLARMHSTWPPPGEPALLVTYRPSLPTAMPPGMVSVPGARGRAPSF
jgi:hypothetical protein